MTQRSLLVDEAAWGDHSWEATKGEEATNASWYDRTKTYNIFHPKKHTTSNIMQQTLYNYQQLQLQQKRLLTGIIQTWEIQLKFFSGSLRRTTASRQAVTSYMVPQAVPRCHGPSTYGFKIYTWLLQSMLLLEQISVLALSVLPLHGIDTGPHLKFSSSLNCHQD